LINIKNKYAFRNLSDFIFTWEITGDGNVVKPADLRMFNSAPGESMQVNFDPKIKPEAGVEYFLNKSHT
jgi:beta-galactosidase